jgi:hypothetical protein
MQLALGVATARKHNVVKLTVQKDREGHNDPLFTCVRLTTNYAYDIFISAVSINQVLSKQLLPVCIAFPSITHVRYLHKLYSQVEACNFLYQVQVK